MKSKVNIIKIILINLNRSKQPNIKSNRRIWVNVFKIWIINIKILINITYKINWWSKD